MGFKTLLSLITTTVIVAVVVVAAAETPDSTLAAAIAEGDSAFRAFDNETARLCYQRAFAIDSTNCEVLWKLARGDVHRGMAVPKDEKLPWFTASEALAGRCVSLCSHSAEAHFFHAVALGQLTKVIGGKRRLELSKEVKREAEATLAIAPRHAGAMHILGRWNYEIAGLGWFTRTAAKIIYGGVPDGSYEQAKEWFERAIAVEPDMPLHHLWLGETLVKLHDYPRARKELQTCVNLHAVLWDDPITKGRARKTLQEIKGEN